MTDSARGGGPFGPPWPVDLLADLHAGALDSELSAQLWPRVNADPESRAVIEALDIVKVELGHLGNAPAGPMPAHVAARLDAALEAEVRQAGVRHAPSVPAAPAPVVGLAEARRRRNRRLAWGTGMLTAAAAAVAVTIALFPGSTTTGNPVAGPKPPLPVDTGNLSEAIGGVTNEKDYGPLRDQARLDECLRANDLDPATSQTMGVRQVTVEGRPGVLALLTAGERGRFRVLIVGPTCGPGEPATIVNVLLPNR